MKTIVLAILIAFLTLSCATERRCYQKFSMAPDTVRIVSVKDSIIYNDTTVYILVPGEVKIDSVIIPCPPPPPAYVPDTARLETDFALAKAWFDYPSIKLYLEQKDKLLKIRLDSAIRESWHWQNQYDMVTQVLKEKYVPKIYKQSLFICIVLLIIFVAWFASKFIK